MLLDFKSLEVSKMFCNYEKITLLTMASLAKSIKYRAIVLQRLYTTTCNTFCTVCAFRFHVQHTYILSMVFTEILTALSFYSLLVSWDLLNNSLRGPCDKSTEYLLVLVTVTSNTPEEKVNRCEKFFEEYVQQYCSLHCYCISHCTYLHMRLSAIITVQKGW